VFIIGSGHSDDFPDLGGERFHFFASGKHFVNNGKQMLGRLGHADADADAGTLNTPEDASRPTRNYLQPKLNPPIVFEFL
jgi:hypothetical protein